MRTKETERERVAAYRAGLSAEQAAAQYRKRADYHRNRFTGWSPADVAAAWGEQSGKCAICTRDLLRSGRKSDSLAADHCHETGAKRALLCRACNLALGVYEARQREHIEIEIYERYMRRFRKE